MFNVYLSMYNIKSFKSTSSDGPEVVGSTAGPPAQVLSPHINVAWLGANLGRSSDRCSSKDSGSVS